jgi:hypothetical protein
MVVKKLKEKTRIDFPETSACPLSLLFTCYSSLILDPLP